MVTGDGRPRETAGLSAGALPPQPRQPPTSPWIKNRIGSVRSTNISMTFRAGWVVHSPVGFVVIPARYNRRVANSMNTSAYNRRNSTVSTLKKSQATIPLAWARRNALHVSDDRRGAGWMPACCKIDQTVLAAIRIPSPASSPRTRR